MININYLSNKTNKMIKTTIETLKTIEDCINCKDKEVGRNGFDELCKLINEIGKKYYLVEDLFKTNIRLNKEVLCEGCKRKEIRKLSDKCENEEIVKFLYKCRLNRKWYYHDYIQWIPFDEFRNIKHLSKSGFGEASKAIWINAYYEYEMKYKEREIILKKHTIPV